MVNETAVIQNLTNPVVIIKDVDLKINAYNQVAEGTIVDVTNKGGLSLNEKGLYFINPVKLSGK